MKINCIVLSMIMFLLVGSVTVTRAGPTAYGACIGLCLIGGALSSYFFGTPASYESCEKMCEMYVEM